MKTTPLHREHLDLNARMMPFAGFDMPIQYAGILEEHHATRTRCSIFDTCHMGEFRLWGPTAIDDLERVLSCDVASLPVGHCRYGLICLPAGSVQDDQILYRLGDSEFMMVVNAGTRETDAQWVSEHLSRTTILEDVSDITAKIDLQGPLSIRAAHGLFDTPLPQLAYYEFCTIAFGGRDLLVSRTGYTGEIGVEIYCPRDLAVPIWHRCLELGAVPAGLGARDTLRLEMGFPLYGHELSRERNAGHSGYTWAMSQTKDFVGSEAIRSPEGGAQRLVGLRLEGRRAARQGDPVCDDAGTPIGRVTSGSFSPSLQCSIALAYLNADAATLGNTVRISARKQDLQATIVKTPFYKKGTARKPIAEFS